MNIFLFNKALRCNDNTTLIYQTINTKNIIPIFIFTEQVNKQKNKYFSNNAVQFMVESLKELSYDIENKYNGKLYLFHSDNFINVFKEISKYKKINSIATNIDYSPYSHKRQNILEKFCNTNNITLYMKEDHVIYDILQGQTLKNDNTPYSVYTPFKNHCLNNLKIRKINKFNKFTFIKDSILETNKYYISNIKLDNFYENNLNIHIHGGRKNGLQILKNANNFKKYSEYKNILTYKTTYLGSHNHFGTVSIREVYTAFKSNKSIINELIWRDFYYNLFYYYPYMLGGQIGKNNSAFKSKYNNIKWNNDKKLFKLWTKGELGIPIVDAGMRQLNISGFMHNRVRMIVSSVLTKLLLIDWKWGEKYFAQKLIDYDCIQNLGGWLWTAGGIDPKQIFRFFNPQLQMQKYDPDAIYVKKYIPELKNIPSNDIINWNTVFIKYKNINYPQPQIDYYKARLNIKFFKVS